MRVELCQRLESGNVERQEEVAGAAAIDRVVGAVHLVEHAAIDCRESGMRQRRLRALSYGA